MHGAGVSVKHLQSPNEKIFDALAEPGYDVWLENWRGSIGCKTNEWDLDAAADNDHPVAVNEVCRITGSKKYQSNNSLPGLYQFHDLGSERIGAAGLYHRYKCCFTASGCAQFLRVQTQRYGAHGKAPDRLYQSSLG